MVIYIPVCHTACCDGKDKIHHLTLAHLDTSDQTIVDMAMKRIKKCIATNNYLINNFHGRIATYTLGFSGPNSTFLEGNVEDFKKSLDVYLRLKPLIAQHLSPYRPAHVDRFDRPVHYYAHFRVEDLKTM